MTYTYAQASSWHSEKYDLTIQSQNIEASKSVKSLQAL